MKTITALLLLTFIFLNSPDAHAQNRSGNLGDYIDVVNVKISHQDQIFDKKSGDPSSNEVFIIGTHQNNDFLSNFLKVGSPGDNLCKKTLIQMLLKKAKEYPVSKNFSKRLIRAEEEGKKIHFDMFFKGEGRFTRDSVEGVWVTPDISARISITESQNGEEILNKTAQAPPENEYDVFFFERDANYSGQRAHKNYQTMSQKSQQSKEDIPLFSKAISEINKRDIPNSCKSLAIFRENSFQQFQVPIYNQNFDPFEVFNEHLLEFPTTVE